MIYLVYIETIILFDINNKEEEKNDLDHKQILNDKTMIIQQKLVSKNKIE